MAKPLYWPCPEISLVIVSRFRALTAGSAWYQPFGGLPDSMVKRKSKNGKLYSTQDPVQGLQNDRAIEAKVYSS